MRLLLPNEAAPDPAKTQFLIAAGWVAIAGHAKQLAALYGSALQLAKAEQVTTLAHDSTHNANAEAALLHSILSSAARKDGAP